MPELGEIRRIQVTSEFNRCSQCGYQLGFHVSFQTEADQRTCIILICPECGARYDVGWTTATNR